MSGLKYWVWLSCLKGLKNQTRLALLRHFGSPEDIYYADEKDLFMADGIEKEQVKFLKDRSMDAADKILGDCQRLNIRVMTMQDAEYPGRLRDIYDPPCLLYIKGRLPVIDEEAVITVVGTRNCTPYGMMCAERISYGLTSGGAIVASGLARGIDTAASRGALMAGGVTLGLLGCGLDVIYPRENKNLYEDIISVGALISEYPPGTSPLPGNFPARNRIMAGISVGVVVVEAPPRSGALITASQALEQGRDIYAVPGPINAFASQGCNQLIRAGAGLVTDAREILQDYAFRFPEKFGAAKELPTVLEEMESPGKLDGDLRQDKSEENDQDEVLEIRDVSISDGNLTDDQIELLELMDIKNPIQTDDLIDQSGIPTRRVLSALTILEIDGMIRQHIGKRYTRLINLIS